MRVLHIISGLGTGGAESFLVALSSRLKALGIEQEIVSVTGRGANADRLTDAGLVVHDLGVAGLGSAAGAVRPLRAIVQRFNPDVLQGWMYHGDLFATLAKALAPARPRLYWNIRCSDMRLEDYSAQLRLAVRASALLSRRPDAVISNSRAGANVHTAVGYRPRSLVIIPNGIDTVRFAPDPAARAAVRRELGLSPDQPMILHVARVDPMKDHATLLAAAAGVDGAATVLAGKGTDELADRPGLPGLGDNPGVVGLGERPDVPRLLAAADIIVSSSAYGEGFSNSIAEGMSAGLVPIATDVGDVQSIIGETGEVIPVRDVHALRAAIARALVMPAPERARRGLAARQRIIDNFSLDRAVATFAALYQSE